MQALVIGAIVRGLIQLAAGAGVALAPDAATQIAAGVVALGTLAWSIYQKKKTAK